MGRVSAEGSAAQGRETAGDGREDFEIRMSRREEERARRRAEREKKVRRQKIIMAGFSRGHFAFGYRYCRVLSAFGKGIVQAFSG